MLAHSALEHWQTHTYRLISLHPVKLHRTRRADGLRIGLAGGGLPSRRGQALGLFERTEAAPGQALTPAKKKSNHHLQRAVLRKEMRAQGFAPAVS